MYYNTKQTCDFFQISFNNYDENLAPKDPNKTHFWL